MNVITVVDARMGRGKSSAAIRYMNRYKGSKRFLYITPYLNETDRICEQCDFDQFDNDYMSKSTELKMHMRNGKNVAATHSLFYLMDEDALVLAKEQGYSLIIDESINVIERINITAKDCDLVRSQLTTEDSDGFLRWIDNSYSGKLDGYKKIADAGSLCVRDGTLLNIMNPHMLEVFREVFMLTYLFDGQYQKAYLEYFGFEYRIVGVESDDDGFFFSDMPDSPPPIDYKELIHIEDSVKLNEPGKSRYALSKNWFARRNYNHPDVKGLRNGLKKFFQSSTSGDASTRLWTSFKSDLDKLTDAKTHRFRNNFLQVSARATNEFKDRTDIAYMANRFVDPNLMKFFSDKDISINADHFALAEMLQWIWRSAIRDNKPINLYIPSSRMRGLLIDWIENTYQGDNLNE